MIEAWIGRSAGLVLVALSAIGWISIITWSNFDPSLTHTTAEPTRNLLGPLGAIISDLLLQTLGVGALFVLGGPLVWGLELASARRVPLLTRKLVMFPAAILVLAGGLSSLPTLPSWPLHHGFGGLLGDLLFNMVSAVLAIISMERAGMLAGLVLLVAGAVALVHSFGLSVSGIVGGGVARLSTGERKRHHGAGKAALDAEQDDSHRAQSFDDPLAGYQPAADADDEEHEEHGEEVQDEDLGPRRDQDHRDVHFGVAPAAAYDLAREEPVAAHRDVAPSDYELDPIANDEDPALSEARAFARRFAPANATAAAAAANAAAANSSPAPAAAGVEPEESTARGVGPYQLPAMLRGFSPARPKGWRRPQLGLLATSGPRASETTPVILHERAALLVDVLADFGVQGEVRDVRSGPVVTLFEFQPARGIKTSRIIALADDVARAMSANSARVAIIPGRTTIGIELPNAVRHTVLLRDVLDSDAFQSSKAKLPLALGCAIGGEPVVADLARMPHLLVAGTTGSGKSVGINAMILSLLYKLDPKQCRLLLIDPKMLELSAYEGIPHLLAPVVTDPARAVAALDWAVAEMEERYKRMARLGVRNIETFNERVEQALERGEALARTVQTGFDPRTGEPVYEHQAIDEAAMPYIVIVADEFADLMMTAGRQLETAVQRLAQKARAAGIHLIMATQRPSVDVVTGTIKSNFPTRISFRVASKVDSRTILGDAGAEQLLGHGDMLLAGGAGQPLRVHGAFVGEDEVEGVAAALKAQGRPNFEASITRAPVAAERAQGKRQRPGRG